MRTEIVLLSFLGAAMLSCDLPSHEEPDCDLIGLTSAGIYVEDEAGAALPGAVVTYQVDGGEWRPTQCMSGDNAEDCAAFGTATELTGRFLVHVEKDGYVPVEILFDIHMGPDGCHIQGTAFTVRLFPEDCQ